MGCRRTKCSSETIQESGRSECEPSIKSGIIASRRLSVDGSIALRRRDVLGSRSVKYCTGEEAATKGVLAVQSRLREALVLSQQAALRDKEAVERATEVKLRSERDQHQKELMELKRAAS